MKDEVKKEQSTIQALLSKKSICLCCTMLIVIPLMIVSIVFLAERTRDYDEFNRTFNEIYQQQREFLEGVGHLTPSEIDELMYELTNMRNDARRRVAQNSVILATIPIISLLALTLCVLELRRVLYRNDETRERIKQEKFQRKLKRKESQKQARKEWLKQELDKLQE